MTVNAVVFDGIKETDERRLKIIKYLSGTLSSLGDNYDYLKQCFCREIFDNDQNMKKITDCLNQMLRDLWSCFYPDKVVPAFFFREIEAGSVACYPLVDQFVVRCSEETNNISGAHCFFRKRMSFVFLYRNQQIIPFSIILESSVFGYDELHKLIRVS